MKFDMASLGGVNVEKGQSGRRGLFPPVSEEERNEQYFLTRNDRLHPVFLSLDEMEIAADGDCLPNIDDAASSLLAMENNISGSQILAAAEAVLEDPHLLVDLYRSAFNVEGFLFKKEGVIAREKVFRLIIRIAAGMVYMENPSNITRSFTLRSEDGLTLLQWFARAARNEAMNDGFGYWAATTILKELGHPNSFARYLD